MPDVQRILHMAEPEQFEAGPGHRFISRCWDITSDIEQNVNVCVQIKTDVKTILYDQKPERISQGDRNTSESFLNYFHMITWLPGPKDFNSHMKSNEICEAIESF